MIRNLLKGTKCGILHMSQSHRIIGREGVDMASTVNYWKPNMAAMPADVGRRVIAEIMNSKPADQKAIHEKNEKVREMIRQEREQRKNEQQSMGK